MTGRLITTFGLLLAAQIAVAGPYDGTYRQAANADCGLVGVDGASIRIADGIFYGVESECRLTQPVNVVDMDATLYSLQCTGEGSQWTERVMLMLAKDEDALIMVWNGYAFKYSRCPAE